MLIIHNVINHNKARHSRHCFRRGKLVPADAGSGNPDVVPAKAGNQEEQKYWIPPYQVRGRLGQARNDKPQKIYVVVYMKANSAPCNSDGFILIPVIPYAAIEVWLRLGLNAKALLGNWPDLSEKTRGRPVVAVLLGCQEWMKQVRELCGKAIATVNTPEAAAKALSSLYRINQLL